MSPSLALLVWLVLLLALLWFDPARERETSLALWVPAVWIFIVATRLPSQWLAGEVGISSGSLEGGNPLDRNVYCLLILLAIGILVSRSFKWGDFFARNLALTVFLAFALLSVTWSDLPYVAFKRWFRDLGNYLVVFIALSDPRPVQAVGTLFRRLGYLLIPLSLLLVKYYPAIGMQYNEWTGSAMYVGPATSKNDLGVICLISGLFFFWDTVQRWGRRRDSRTKRIILVNLAFLAMTLYLLHVADSATSRVCLAIGCLMILAAHSNAGRRHPGFLKFAIPAGLCLYLTLAFGFGVDINAVVARAVGRNPTLTDRTLIWKILLGMHTNPLLGTGFESFWLGSRLRWLWQQSQTTGINEAHNGYLETYLDLGLVGLVLLCGFFISAYRNICRRFSPFSSFASLSFALWTVALFYNVTEAAFSWQYMWLAFLVGALAVSGRAEHPEHVVSTSHHTDTTDWPSESTVETTVV